MATASWWVFILGACVGSFLNVVIFRVPAGESVLYPPSRCQRCGRQLRLMDLIPVISFLLLRGRCRTCRDRISWQYPLVEMLTGLLFLMIWQAKGFSWITLSGFVLASVLVAVSFIDLEHYIIPNEILVVGVLLGIPLLVMESLLSTGWGVVAGLAAGAFMLGVSFISKGGMGAGDIKLAAFMGLFLGPRLVILGIFMAFVAGGLVAGILLISRIKGRKDAIPFGPFLALGGLTAFLQGTAIVNWYVNLLT